MGQIRLPCPKVYTLVRAKLCTDITVIQIIKCLRQIKPIEVGDDECGWAILAKMTEELSGSQTQILK